MKISVAIEDSELLTILNNNNWQPTDRGIYYRGVYLLKENKLGEYYSEDIRKLGDKYLLNYGWEYYSPDIKEGGLKFNNDNYLLLMSKEEASIYCQLSINKAYCLIGDYKKLKE